MLHFYFSSLFLPSFRRSPAATTQPPITRVCLPGKKLRGMSRCVSEFCKAAQRTRLFFYLLYLVCTFPCHHFSYYSLLPASLLRPLLMNLRTWRLSLFSPSVLSSSAVVQTVLSSNSLSVSKHKWTGISDKHSHTVWSIKAARSRMTTNLLFLSFIAFDSKLSCVSVCVCIYPFRRVRGSVWVCVWKHRWLCELYTRECELTNAILLSLMLCLWGAIYFFKWSLWGHFWILKVKALIWLKLRYILVKWEEVYIQRLVMFGVRHLAELVMSYWIHYDNKDPQKYRKTCVYLWSVCLTSHWRGVRINWLSLSHEPVILI